MSSLISEINRMRDLMGIKTQINENYFKKNILLLEETGYGQAMDIYKGMLKKVGIELSEEEQKYLKAFVDEFNRKFPSEKIDFSGGLDNLTRKTLNNFLTKETEEVVGEVFERAIKNIEADIAIKQIQTPTEVLRTKLTNNNILSSGGEAKSLTDYISFIYQKGGVENSNIPPDTLTFLKMDLEEAAKKLVSTGEETVKKYVNDLIGQIDELEGTSVKTIDPEIKTSVADLKTSLKPAVENQLSKVDISNKLKSLADADQSMRLGNEMDVEVDLSNQTDLKNLMGNDPESFIKSLDSMEDLQNVWIIVQHSDNDINFQKQILSILQKNQQFLETKFTTEASQIKSGIAMLEDRVMVNSNTSVTGYRETGMDDFGDLTKGKQTYGSQGGMTPDGSFWVPRPIELDGKIYFFETPQKLLDDTEFLNKLNAKRTSMGLSKMEDYLKLMNDELGVVDELVDDLVPAQYLPKNLSDKTVFSIFSKKGIFYSEGINLTRELIDKFLSESQKLYVDAITKKELQDYITALNYLKNKFGNGKIYVTSLLDGKTIEKKTIGEFITDVENNFKRIYDEQGNWSPLNKLDTNYNDMPKEMTTFIKTVLNPEEYENFVKKIQDFENAPANSIEKEQAKKLLEDEFKNIKSKLLTNENYVKNWTKRVDELTQSIKNNSALGNLSETKVNETLKNNNFKILFTASDGSPIDVLLNIDQIVEDTSGVFGGGIKTVQTKTANSIQEGKFVGVGKDRKFVPEEGTGIFKVEITANKRIAKQSQIDLAGFYDPQTGKTLIVGKQPKLSGTYNPDGTPQYLSQLELPGSTIPVTKSPIKPIIIDKDTPKIFQ